MFSFFSEFGWYLEGSSNREAAKFVEQILVVVSVIQRIQEISEKGPKNFDEMTLVIQELQPLFSSLKQLSFSLDNIDALVLSELPIDLLLYLTSWYLFGKSPQLYYALEILTVLYPLDNEPAQIDNRLLRGQSGVPFLNFKRILDLLKSPDKTLSSAYWPEGLKDLSASNKVAQTLAYKFQGLLSILGIEAYYGRGEGPEEFPTAEELRFDSFLTIVKHFWTLEPDTITTVGSTIGLLPEDEGGPGVILLPFGQTNFSTTLGELELDLQIDTLSNGIQITKDGFDLVDTDLSKSVGGRLQVQRLSLPDFPAFQFGSIESIHFTIGTFGFDIGLRLSEQRQEFSAMVVLNNIKLKVQSEKEDTFLKSILPSRGLEAEANTEFGYSNLTGFHFKGSGGLEI